MDSINKMKTILDTKGLDINLSEFTNEQIDIIFEGVSYDSKK